MNVYNKIFSLILFIFIFSSSVFSFNICNVEFNEPFFDVKSSENLSVLLCDNDGDIYFEGKDHNLNNKDIYDSFVIGNNAFFNKITSKFNSFVEDLGILPNYNDSLEIKNNLNQTTSLFRNSGDIYTKGKGVYQGSQSGCLADGNYCNFDTVENRDYYCNLLGDKSGHCTYNVLSSENCLLKSSVDSDSGNNHFTKGTLKDYVSCNAGVCLFNSYTDSCLSGDTLKEFSPNGASFSVSNVNCNIHDSYYCSYLSRYKRDYSCSLGSCSSKNVFVETCNNAPSSSVTWSCASSTQKKKTTVSYSNVCNPGSCGVTSYSSSQVYDCPSGQQCSSGSCKCFDSSWSPSSSNYCSGVSFTQTSNCGKTRINYGTKTTGSCAPPPTCTPKTCSELGKTCGIHNDGCEGIVNCGSCSSEPICTPKTCSELGKTCGIHNDGCEGTVNCGTCNLPSNFYGGETKKFGTYATDSFPEPNYYGCVDVRIKCENTNDYCDIYWDKIGYLIKHDGRNDYINKGQSKIYKGNEVQKNHQGIKCHIKWDSNDNKIKVVGSVYNYIFDVYYYHGINEIRTNTIFWTTLS